MLRTDFFFGFSGCIVSNWRRLRLEFCCSEYPVPAITSAITCYRKQNRGWSQKSHSPYAYTQYSLLITMCPPVLVGSTHNATVNPSRLPALPTNPSRAHSATAVCPDPRARVPLSPHAATRSESPCAKLEDREETERRFMQK